MKYGEYPIGHPRVIKNDNNDFDFSQEAYYGLMHCTLNPPRKLFHPVLPTKINSTKGARFHTELST